MIDLVTIDYDDIVLDRDDLGAVLFRIDDDEVWVPRSKIQMRDEEDKTFEVPEWFAFKEELI